MAVYWRSRSRPQMRADRRLGGVEAGERSGPGRITETGSLFLSVATAEGFAPENLPF